MSADEAAPTPLDDLHSICAEIYERWDKDMRSGKLLQALAGNLRYYDPRVERVRARLAQLEGSDHGE